MSQTSGLARSVWRNPAAFAPQAFEGVRSRRIVALGFDLILITLLFCLALIALVVLGIVTFGLTWFLIPPLYPLVAFFYNGLSVSGAGMATPGMRAMDLEVRLNDGAPAPFLNAALHAVLFYLSVTLATPLVLLVSLLTADKRCLHDIFSGVIVLRRFR